MLAHQMSKRKSRGPWKIPVLKQEFPLCFAEIYTVCIHYIDGTCYGDARTSIIDLRYILGCQFDWVP